MLILLDTRFHISHTEKGEKINWTFSCIAEMATFYLPLYFRMLVYLFYWAYGHLKYSHTFQTLLNVGVTE